MTDREMAIVSAYTGYAMLCGEKFNIFHRYCEELLGRPMWTHEFPALADKIHELSKPDFIKLCKGECVE